MCECVYVSTVWVYMQKKIYMRQKNILKLWAVVLLVEKSLHPSPLGFCCYAIFRIGARQLIHGARIQDIVGNFFFWGKNHCIIPAQAKIWFMQINPNCLCKLCACVRVRVRVRVCVCVCVCVHQWQGHGTCTSLCLQGSTASNTVTPALSVMILMLSITYLDVVLAHWRVHTCCSTWSMYHIPTVANSTRVVNSTENKTIANCYFQTLAQLLFIL